MSYFNDYDRYHEMNWNVDADEQEPFEMHADADLGWPSGAVAAVECAAFADVDA